MILILSGCIRVLFVALALSVVLFVFAFMLCFCLSDGVISL